MPSRYVVVALVSSAFLALAPAAGALAAPAPAPPMGQAWEAWYDGSGLDADTATAVAADPVTGTVVVTGNSNGPGRDDDITTVAYSSSGATLWSARAAGSDGHDDIATAVTIDATHGRAYVVGSLTQGGWSRAVVLAYDLSGTELWRQVTGSAQRSGVWSAVTVDPVSGTVFVTGASIAADYSEGVAVTRALDPRGSTRWNRTYDGQPGRDTATALTLDPTASALYVSGHSDEPAGPLVGFVLGYTVSGTQRWSTAIDAPGPDSVLERDLVAAPEAGGVYVASTTGSTSRLSAVADDGSLRWQRTLTGVAGGRYTARAVAVDATSGTVYLTGHDTSPDGRDTNVITAAHDPAGRPLWTRTTDVTAGLFPDDAVVDPIGGRLYVSASSSTDTPQAWTDAVVLGYDRTGAVVAGYRRSASTDARPAALALDPAARRLYLVGREQFGASARPDYLTVALALP